MTPTNVANKIVSLIKERGGALFNELVEEVGEEALGDFAILLKENVLLWSGVSEVFAEGFQLAQPSIDGKRANPKAYACFSDNLGFPDLPIITAEEWAEGKLEYTEMHWIPLVFFIKKGSSNEQANLARSFFSSAPISGGGIASQILDLDTTGSKT